MEKYEDNLIDLLYEKQNMLKKQKEDQWNHNNSIPVTNTEWCILSLVYGKQPTIPEVTQQLGISRQATHKSIKTLDSKGFISICRVENNKRNKYLNLTSFGEACYLKNQQLKEEIEKEIGQNIGDENITLLKELLKRDWI